MRKALKNASKLATLSPREIARLRSSIQRSVTNVQKDVDLVLIGEKKWSPTQFNLYKLLLNKIVPDISTTYVEQNDKTTRRISGLSRLELEEMVAERQGSTTNTDAANGRKPPVFDNQDNFDASDSDEK